MDINIRNILIRIGTIAYRKLEAHRYFSINALGNISDLDEGLKDRKNTENDQKIIIDRIINSYKKAKIRQKVVSLPYQPTSEWDNLIKEERGEYLEALQNNDKFKLNELMINFFRNSGVSGLMTYGYYSQISTANIYNRKMFIMEVIKDFLTLTEFIDNSNFNTKDLSVPMIGNPWGYMVNGNLIIPTACSHYYYALHVKNLLRNIKNPIIGEIGGGFGGFAYFLLSANKNLKYINFDLPEVLLIAQYYLMNIFPEKKILLYGEKENSINKDELIKSYDIILMPNFVLPEICDNAIDLFINTHSLSEMDYDTCEEYIKQICRVTKKYFFHENSGKPVKKRDNHIEVISSKFPIPLDIFTRVYMHKSLWGSGGLIESRYREYLYEKNV